MARLDRVDERLDRLAGRMERLEGRRERLEAAPGEPIPPCQPLRVWHFF